MFFVGRRAIRSISDLRLRRPVACLAIDVVILSPTGAGWLSECAPSPLPLSLSDMDNRVPKKFSGEANETELASSSESIDRTTNSLHKSDVYSTALPPIPESGNSYETNQSPPKSRRSSNERVHQRKSSLRSPRKEMENVEEVEELEHINDRITTLESEDLQALLKVLLRYNLI